MIDKLLRKITSKTHASSNPIITHTEAVKNSTSKSMTVPHPVPVKAASKELQLLLDKCGSGDAAAMASFAAHIKQHHPKADQWVNMWIVRAAIYGDISSQEVVMRRIKEQPTFLRSLPIPWENFIPGKRESWHSGTYPGKILNEVGFLAFQPNGMYLLAGLNEDRFMIIWEEDDYDPPDEDGFGAEEYYNMFCLDEFYQPISGVPVVKSVSTRDIRYVSSCKEKYENMVSMARQAIKARPQFPLWLDFIPSAEK